MEFLAFEGKIIKKVMTTLIFISISTWGSWLMAVDNPLIKKVDVTVIENPKPNCEETVYVELKKVGEVDEDINDEEFLVMPWSLVVDDAGNIFVYDAMMGKIYKYDKNLKFKVSFGGKGYGPGEFGHHGSRGSGFIYLYLGNDNLIYAGDRFNKKIVCFDTSGKLVKEFRVEVKTFAFIRPVLDSKRNIYLHSKERGIIDVFTPNGEYANTFLSKNLLAKALFYKMKKPLNQLFYTDSDTGTVLHEMLTDDTLLVYFKSSGVMYFVKDNSIIKKWEVRPKKILGIYKKHLSNSIINAGKYEGFFPFFRYIIVDRDNEKYINLHYGRPFGSDRNYLYQFDLDGKLSKVLYITENVDKAVTKFHCKKHGLYYAVGRNDEFNQVLRIYKEEKKK